MPNDRARQIQLRLQTIRDDIREWCRQYQRPADSVKLLAVSKHFPVSDLQAAWEAEQRCFGESYLNEALDKIQVFAGLPAEWHFIGPMQSNKTRRIAENFNWVQSLDRLKIAERLNEQRPDDRPPLNVCLQVNISGETSKSGLEYADLEPLARAVAELPRLKLRGLMAIPARTRDFTAQRQAFATLRAAFDTLNNQGFELDTLSMGMSGDMEAAIAEGSTLLRIGTGIFGPRQ